MECHNGHQKMCITNNFFSDIAWNYKFTRPSRWPHQWVIFAMKFNNSLLWKLIFLPPSLSLSRDNNDDSNKNDIEFVWIMNAASFRSYSFNESSMAGHACVVQRARMRRKNFCHVPELEINFTKRERERERERERSTAKYWAIIESAQFVEKTEY